MTSQEKVELIKTLRKITGLGLMDCRKVLMEYDWDLDTIVRLIQSNKISRISRTLCGKMNTRCETCNLDKCVEFYNAENLRCIHCKEKKCLKDRGYDLPSFWL